MRGSVGRVYYKQSAEPSRDWRDTSPADRLKTVVRFIEYAAPQIMGRDTPFGAVHQQGDRRRFLALGTPALPSTPHALLGGQGAGRPLARVQGLCHSRLPSALTRSPEDSPTAR